MSVAELYLSLRDAVRKVVFGQDDAIDLSLAALLASGHVLLEGPPGTAKTLLVRTIAAALDMQFQRLQMTPDLLPSDVTGSAIYREDRHTFEFRRGPIFANFLLVDEINRASARTQSAMLEAMQELQVTFDGTSHPLPEPFIVFATENPIEQEGTYPLPLAQLDRFMFKVLISYPDGPAECRVMREHHATAGRSNPTLMGVQPVARPEDLIQARIEIRDTFVREEVISYVSRLLQATRGDDALSVGASPRSGLMLLMAAKSLARFDNRDFVTPDDIKRIYLPALRHRVVLSPSSELEGLTSDDALIRQLDSVEVPR